MKKIFVLTLSLLLTLYAESQNNINHSISLSNGISVQTIPFNATIQYAYHFPFLTTQIGYCLNKELQNKNALRIGINSLIYRNIYEEFFPHIRSIRSEYYLSLPILFEKKYEIKKNKPNSQMKKYRSIYGGLSVDWYVAQFDNLFYYEFNGYMPDDNGDLVYVELLLRGKDAKQYNTFRFINNQIPLAMSFHFGLSKYYILENNAELETGFNFQLMDVVSLYNENLFFPDNGLKFNFSFLLAYHFGKKE